MENDNLKLTSSEIGTLWGEYVNGTMTDIVNRYMVSIIEDESIKKVFLSMPLRRLKNKSNNLFPSLKKKDFPFQLDLLSPTSIKGKSDCFLTHSA